MDLRLGQEQNCEAAVLSVPPVTNTMESISESLESLWLDMKQRRDDVRFHSST